MTAVDQHTDLLQEAPDVRRSATPDDWRILRELALRGRPFLVLDEDEEWISDLVGDARGQVHRMARRGLLSLVARGRYVVLPAGASNASQAAPFPVLLVAALAGRREWYLGFLSALIDHGLTDYDSNEVFIASRGPGLPSQFKVAGRNVHVTRVIQESKWTGIERQRASGRVFYQRSDLEKTLVDTLEHPRLCGPTEVWVRAWERVFRERDVDVLKLIDYAQTSGALVSARCAFWLRELRRPREARLLMKALGGPVTGKVSLTTSTEWGAGPWPRDRETGLLVNIPEGSIAGWLEYGK